MAGHMAGHMAGIWPAMAGHRRYTGGIPATERYRYTAGMADPLDNYDFASQKPMVCDTYLQKPIANQKKFRGTFAKKLE